MPLTKSRGNMYPWVTHTHSHLGGKCPHGCEYCYVQVIEKRYKTGRYAGDLRLIEKELDVRYGSGKTIFIDHMNDLWAEEVPPEYRNRVVDHCLRYPDNEYVFQTKNPAMYLIYRKELPPHRLLGCTIETTDPTVTLLWSPGAPTPNRRRRALLLLKDERLFVTIEPIAAGDMRQLADWIHGIRPEFVNIGADSKGSTLPEPTSDDIQLLLDLLQEYRVPIRQKRNLGRLLDGNT